MFQYGDKVVFRNHGAIGQATGYVRRVLSTGQVVVKWYPSGTEVKHWPEELVKESDLRSFTAKLEILDVARIEQFRRDFLMLMKNSGRTQDYDQTMQWKRAVSRWANAFEDYAFKDIIGGPLENAIYRKQVSEGDGKYFDKKLREKLWDFVTDFRVPISEEDNYYSKESRFARFQQELPTWDRRIRQRARQAWAVLDEFVDWYARQTGAIPQVNVPQLEDMEMAGFAVRFKGHDTVENAAKYVEHFREGLKRYNSKASQRLPWLIQNQLPILLDFRAEIDKGGLYEYNHISMSPYAFYDNPDDLAHALAHEMAHHLYRTLGSAAQNYWESMLRGDLGELDLREVIKKYNDNEFIYSNDKMERQDPFLYNQLMGLNYSPAAPKELKNAMRVLDIREYLAKGGNPIMSVHKKPISGYANRNSEEAFCEAVGYLVSYGPNSLSDEVLGWLKTILPGIHTASSRIAAIAERLVEQRTATLLDDYGMAEGLADKLWNKLGLKRVYDLVKSDSLAELQAMTPSQTVGNLIDFADRNMPEEKRAAYAPIRYDVSFIWNYGSRYFGDPAYRPENTTISLQYNLALPLFLREYGIFENSKEKLLADIKNRHPVSVRHEVTHALRDAETKHIKRFTERMMGEKKIQESYVEKHDQLEFERDAIVNSLDTLKRRLGDKKWDKLSLNDFENMVPFLRVLTDLKGPTGREWARRLLREGLVGRRMLEEMRHIVGNPL